MNPTARFSFGSGSILFWVGLLAYAVAILALPLFPNQDGPVHLYYATVLEEVAESASLYNEFFRIKTWLPPYVSMTALFVLSNQLFSPIVSEKIVVCIHLLLLCAGFRYLVRSVNPADDVIPLLVFPFALHRLVFMGFYNFCLATALLLWTCGFWMRHHDELTRGRTVTFATLLVLLLFTHPVPLVMVALFVGAHLSVGLWRTFLAVHGGWYLRLKSALRTHRLRLFHLLLVFASVAYVLSFLSSDKVYRPYLAPTHIWRKAVRMVTLQTVLPYHDRLSVVVIGLPLVLAAALVAWAIWKRRGDLRLRPEDLLPLFALASGLVFLFAPAGINDAWHLDERFPVFAVLFLLASAAACRLSRRIARLLRATFAGVAFVSLALIIGPSIRFAHSTAVLEELPTVTPYGRGAILLAGRTHQPANPQDATFSPCMWAPAHYFRRSKASLLNAPWLDLSYVFLGLTDPGPYSHLDPPNMAEYLVRGVDDQDAVMPERLDLIVAVDCTESGRDRDAFDRVAASFGLSPMPWSTRMFTFYAKSEEGTGVRGAHGSSGRGLRSAVPAAAVD